MRMTCMLGRGFLMGFHGFYGMMRLKAAIERWRFDFETRSQWVVPGFLLVFCIVFGCLELPFLEQWFRKGSNLVATRLTRWNPGVSGIWRGSVVPEGFQLDLRKIRNMKSCWSEVPRSFAGILHCVLLPWDAFSGTVVQEGFQLNCNTAYKMKSWGLTCLSWIGGSGGAPPWFEESMQYEIHRSEVPRSLAGILHCFAALSCLFLCLRCLSWISGSGGVPTWFQESIWKHAIWNPQVLVVDQWFWRAPTPQSKLEGRLKWLVDGILILAKMAFWFWHWHFDFGIGLGNEDDLYVGQRIFNGFSWILWNDAVKSGYWEMAFWFWNAVPVSCPSEWKKNMWENFVESMWSHSIHLFNITWDQVISTVQPISDTRPT